MKKNDIIISIIIIPIVLGIVLSVAFFLYFRSNADILLPAADGTVFAYHDEKNSDSGIVDKSDLQELAANDNIGTLSSGGTSLVIKYDADYSNLAGSVSLKDGSNAFGEIGCVYLSTYAAPAKGIDASDILSVESIFGNFKYKYVEEYTAESEYEILTEFPDVSRGLVIYYRNSDGAGLTAEYKALVFEEMN